MIMLVSLNYKANVSVTKPRAFRKLVVHTIVCAGLKHLTTTQKP